MINICKKKVVGMRYLSFIPRHATASDISDNVTYVYEVCYAKSVSYEQSLQQWEFEIIRVR